VQANRRAQRVSPFVSPRAAKLLSPRDRVPQGEGEASGSDEEGLKGMVRELKRKNAELTTTNGQLMNKVDELEGTASIAAALARLDKTVGSAMATITAHRDLHNERVLEMFEGIEASLGALDRRVGAVVDKMDTHGKQLGILRDNTYKLHTQHEDHIRRMSVASTAAFTDPSATAMEPLLRTRSTMESVPEDHHQPAKCTDPSHTATRTAPPPLIGKADGIPAMEPEDKRISTTPAVPTAEAAVQADQDGPPVSLLEELQEAAEGETDSDTISDDGLVMSTICRASCWTDEGVQYTSYPREAATWWNKLKGAFRFCHSCTRRRRRLGPTLIAISGPPRRPASDLPSHTTAGCRDDTTIKYSV